MKRVLLSLPCVVFTLLIASRSLAAIHYVDVAAAGSNSGASWANAYTNLQSALSIAVASDEVRVAAGNYIPTSSTNRTVSFVLPQAVALYGGYPTGGGTRDWNAHVTTLSGDIGTPGIPTDNSQHVVVGANLARLDGVTVTLGYWDANDVGPREGAGLYVDGNKFMTVANCRFVNNHSWYRGAGIYFGFVANSSVGPLVSNCYFSGNNTTYGGAQGAALHAYHRVPITVVDSTFVDNTSAAGPAIWGQYCDLTVRRCVFARNISDGQGGAVWLSRPDLTEITPFTLTDCLFYANRASSGGALYCERTDYAGGDRIANCRFYANETSQQGGAVYLYRYAGVMEDCVLSGNRSSAHDGGAFASLYGSPTLRRIVAVGNTSGYRGGAIFGGGHPSYPASPRFENVLAAGNLATYNGGAFAFYYLYGGTATVVNCTVTSNRTALTGSPYHGGGFFFQEAIAQVTNSIVHGNRAPTGLGNEVSLMGATKTVWGHNDIGGGFAGFYNPDSATNIDQVANISTNPLFEAAVSGTWTHDGLYTNGTGQTILRDNTTTWATNTLAGKLLNPDATNGLIYFIAANTDHTISILGNATNAVAGHPYELLDYHLGPASLCIDTASPYVAPTNDAAGQIRPRGLSFDIGAYETVLTGDSIAPGNITGLTALGGQAQVRLDWTNPGSADFAAVLVLRRMGAAPTGTPISTNTYLTGSTLDDGTVAYMGPGDNSTPGNASGFTDVGLNDQTTYHYKVFALDRVPNYAGAMAAFATTEVDTTPPNPIAALTAARGDGQIAFTWTNPVQTDYAGVLVLRRIGAPPTGSPAASTAYSVNDVIGDGTVAYVGPGTDATPLAQSSWTDSYLPNQTNVYYRFFAYDEMPLYASPVATSAIPLAENIIYVDIDAGPGGNGASWQTAYNDLSQALTQAGSGTNLWVAEGTYTPGTARTATFQLAPNSGVFGGFAGNENSVLLRNWNTHPTLLSGEIGAATNTDNCLHVVTATGANNAVLDGFTVTRGYAWDSGSDTDPSRNGGGLLLSETVTPMKTTIRNCRFVNNAANYRGGAIALIYNLGSAEAGAVISNCVFAGNYTFRTGNSSGGAIYKYHYRPIWIFDSQFVSNRAYSAGAIRDELGDTIAHRCTFIRNTAEYTYAAIYNNRSNLSDLNNLSIDGCTFAANQAQYVGAVRLERTYLTGDAVRNCRFYANRATAGYAAALHLYTYNGLVENCIFSGNSATAVAQGGAISLEYSGPRLRNLTIVGTETYFRGGGIFGTTGAPYNTPVRAENLLIAGNMTRYDGGGVCLYDYTGNTSTWINCTIVNNRTFESNSIYGGGGFYVRGCVNLMTNTIVWNNVSPAGGSQGYLTLAETRLDLGYTDIQGGTAGIANPNGASIASGAGMLDVAPGFQDVIAGAWSAPAAYDASNGKTVLTAGGAGWTPGELTGKLLNPNATVSNLLFYIADNTPTTISILGDASAATNGAPFRIWDFRLKGNSPCVDIGTAAGVTNDLDGVTRPQGYGYELGAYERIHDPTAPDPVTGLSAVGGLDVVTLSWTNPTNSDFKGVVIVRRVGAAPDLDPTSTNTYTVGDALGNGTVVYVGPGSSALPGAPSGWLDAPRDHLTAFHYAVYARDDVPNYAPRANATATTLVDAVNPAPVTGLRAIGGHGQVALVWTNPVSLDLAGVLILRRDGAVPPTGMPANGVTYSLGNVLGDGTVVYVGPAGDPAPGAASGWTDTGLPNLSRYAYTVYAYDEVPNYSSGQGDQGHTGLPGTIFVDDNATGLNDGISWQDAYTSLHAAAVGQPAGLTYWVAQGSYYPGTPTNPIPVQANDIFLGGFSGTETVDTERQWAANPTIISGDWTGDQVSDMQTQPLVYWDLGGANNMATMDGFILQYGRNNSGSGPVGGGIGVHVSIQNGSMTIRHCTFRHNIANLGGAIAHNYGNSRVENCLFFDNETTQGEFGGAMYLRRGRVAFINCTLTGNRSAGARGSDIRTIDTNNGSAFDAVNCIFYSAPGSAFQANTFQPSTMLNCNANQPATVLDPQTGNPTTTFIGTIDADPKFVDPASDFHLLPASPCINTGTGGGAPADDLDGGTRPFDDFFDMGAYEFGNLLPGAIPSGPLLIVK